MNIKYKHGSTNSKPCQRQRTKSLLTRTVKPHHLAATTTLLQSQIATVSTLSQRQNDDSISFTHKKNKNTQNTENNINIKQKKKRKQSYQFTGCSPSILIHNRTFATLNSQTSDQSESENNDTMSTHQKQHQRTIDLSQNGSDISPQQQTIELSSEELAVLFKKKALSDPNSIDKWTRDFLEASVPEGAFSAFVTTSTAIKQGQAVMNDNMKHIENNSMNVTRLSNNSDQITDLKQITQKIDKSIPNQDQTTDTPNTTNKTVTQASFQQQKDELRNLMVSLDFKPTPLKYKLQHELDLQQKSAKSIGRFEMNTLSYAPKQGGYPEGFDVIVVGGGHAGCEAAAAAARSGVRVALVTHRFDTIGAMSCNPSIGGVGKGTLVREVDAMDGLMGRVSDESGIQYKILNRSRGPAVQGPRAQIDRGLYAASMQSKMSSIPNLEIIEASVEDLELDYSSIDLDELQRRQAELDMPDRFTLPGSFDDNDWFNKYHEMIHNNPKLRPSIKGIKIHTGQFISTNHVVLATGTFLRSVLHIGPNAKVYGGRYGDIAAVGLANKLEQLGFRLGRVTTGTPPRLDGRTINYDVCAPQHGDTPPQPFSFLHKEIHPSIHDKQIDTFITHTNESTNQLVAQNWHDLPKFEGNQGRGRGPRYCVSLEGKVRRYPDRLEHRVWLEQEGYLDYTVYPQGVNTAFSPHLQLELMRTITGCEKVEMIRPGYAVEYDYVDPRQSSPSLENGRVRGLFIAGQPNGTTGYEEAAAQGVIAGANAGLSSRAVIENASIHHRSSNLSTDVSELLINNTIPGINQIRDLDIYEEYMQHINQLTQKHNYSKINFLSTAKRMNQINYTPFTVGRERGYTGVMIDDLVTKGATEPYRVFTARSEYRILLRSDNCDHRLTSHTHKNAGIVSNKRLGAFSQRRKLLSSLKDELNNLQYLPHQWTELAKNTSSGISNDGSRRSALHIFANYDQIGWDETIVNVPTDIKKRLVSILDNTQVPEQIQVPDIVQADDGTFTVDAKYVQSENELSYVCRPVNNIIFKNTNETTTKTTTNHQSNQVYTKNHAESDYVEEVIKSTNPSNGQLNIQTKAPKKSKVESVLGAESLATLLKPIWKEVYNEEIGQLVREGKLDGTLQENNPVSIVPCYSSSTAPPTHIMVPVPKLNNVDEITDEQCNELLLKHKNNNLLSEVLTEARYATLISQALNQVKKAQLNQNLHIPNDFDYRSVVTLSTEEIEKLNFKKPRTILDASLIPGLTPVGVQSIASQVLKFSSKVAKLQNMGM